jgi:uncharacterized protein (TIGR03083 family)
MTDDRELEGIDPCDLLDAEAERIDRFLAPLADDDTAWAAPTGCAEWDRRALLAHLAATEEYHQACFDDQLGRLLERGLAAGVSDVHGFNALGVRERADRAPSTVLAEWREANARTRQRFRERQGQDMVTMVGPYPARWQAFHVASELATHADDLGVPVEPDEADGRRAWRVRFSRFALGEAETSLTVRSAGSATTIAEGDHEVTVDDDTLVAAVAGRLPADAGLDDADRALLSTVP